MFFDRYEIHIQAFANVFLLEICHVPILIFGKIQNEMRYSIVQNTHKKQKKTKSRKNMVRKPSNIFEFLMTIFTKRKTGSSQNFLVFIEAFWYNNPRVHFWALECDFGAPEAPTWSPGRAQTAIPFERGIEINKTHFSIKI